MIVNEFIILQTLERVTSCNLFLRNTEQYLTSGYIKLPLAEKHLQPLVDISAKHRDRRE